MENDRDNYLLFDDYISEEIEQLHENFIKEPYYDLHTSSDFWKAVRFNAEYFLDKLGQSTQVLKLQPRSAYGRMLYYPFCDRSRLLIKIRREKRTMNPAFYYSEIQILGELGFSIQYVPYVAEELN